MKRLGLLLMCSFFFFCQASLFGSSPSNQSQDALDKESQQIREKSLEIAKLYQLPKGMQIKEITSDVLANSTTSSSQKARLLHYGRKIFLFQYPSDGLLVKGFISFTPHSTHQPLLIFLRGGNKEFGLPNPALDLASYKDYTVIAPLYRGGLSEGQDEFGGADVNDINNLINFIPKLEEKLNVSFQPSDVFMIGASRGALEMFLSLARFPDLQNKVDKIVSLSGILDLRELMQSRPDMTDMFKTEFGLIPGVNEEEWINYRDPLLTAPQIRKDLPILILEGTDDIRTNPEEGRHMLQKLEDSGHQNVTYWELQGGQHALSNMSDRMDLIAGWLELPRYTQEP